MRRIDELGRVVIPKEIRRTLRIREGDPLLITLTQEDKFCFAVEELAKRQGWGGGGDLKCNSQYMLLDRKR